MKYVGIIICVSCLLFSGCSPSASLSGLDSSFECSFAKGRWNRGDWTMVKKPDSDYFGTWVQKDLYIENQTPADATVEEMQGSRAGETYTSMLLNREFAGRVTVSSTLEFTYKMAPLIVISSEPGTDEDGRVEYREHFEIILYNKGINVWHHYFVDRKPSWTKAAHADFSFKPNVPYTLIVKITPTSEGKKLSVAVGDNQFEYFDDSLPDRFYVGITGCEGLNKFYDFAVKTENRL